MNYDNKKNRLKKIYKGYANCFLRQNDSKK